ncbi:MAG TPA: hypothetical protein VGH90_14330 [Chthoniobacteraceae bacterium]|jgi:hypothetical protein
MTRYLLLLLAALALLSRPAAALDTSREYIILTGGVSLWAWEKFKAEPHDSWWANFVRASRIRIEQIEQQDPNVPITWIVYRPAYIARSKQDSNDLLAHIESVRDAFHTKLIFFDKTQQVIDYLNGGQPRDQVKICGFEYFGHSNRACFMFDYSNNLDSASKCWLHEDDLKQIHRGVFTKDAYAKSWGCHTGEEMSGKFRSATGVNMIGAIGKTQYMTDELPVLSSPEGRWTK